MGKLGAGLIVLAAFLLANAVAAGVYLALWSLLEPLDETLQLAVLFLVGVIAIAGSIFFLTGFLSVVPRWLSGQQRWPH